MDSSKNDGRGTPEGKPKDTSKDSSKDKDQLSKASGSKSETRRKENVDEKQKKKKKEKTPSTSKRHKSEKEKNENDDERKEKKIDKEKHKNKSYVEKRKAPKDPNRKLSELMYTKTEPVISYRFNLSFQNEAEKPESSSKRQKMSERRSLNEDASSAKDVKEDKEEKAKRKSYIDANKLSFQPEELCNTEQPKKDPGSASKKALEKVQDKKSEESPKKVKTVKDSAKKSSVVEETKKDKLVEKVSEKKLEAQCAPEDDGAEEVKRSPKKNTAKKDEIVCSGPVETSKKESPKENMFASRWEDEDSQPPFCNKPNPAIAQTSKVEVNPSLYDDEISLDNQTEDSRDSMDDVFGCREILKNPSPPPNFVADEFEATENVPQKAESIVLNVSEPSSRISDKAKRMPITPLFGIEDIYQQFMKNVKTSTGFDLESKSSGIETSSCISNVTSSVKSKTPSSSSSSSSDSEESDSSTSSTSSSSYSSSSSSSSSSTSTTSKSSPSKCEDGQSSKSNDSPLKAKETALNKETLHDLKMLESLQKGHDIVKEMEKSDKTAAKTDQSKCLNEVEKYLESTKRHLMEVDARKSSLPIEMEKVQVKIEPNASPVRVLLTENEIKKEVTDSSDDESNESLTNDREREMTSPPPNEGDGLSVNREAIKIKISPHTKKQVKTTDGRETEDVDFTEKLLKTTKPSKDENHEKEEVHKVKRKLSVSPYREKSGSPKRKEKEKEKLRDSRSRSRSRSRSSSGSPSRRDRKSPSASPRSKRQPHSSRHKRGYTSPPPRRSRHDSPTARRHNDSYRSKRRSVSPPRRRSRSPYYDRRRYSRSPPYRPPSPKDGSPPNDRRRSVSPTHYNSSSDAGMQYSSHDYYYVQQNQIASDQNSQVHQQYSDYYSNYDYNSCPPEYINSQMSDYSQYGNEYPNTEDPNAYNQIPVIGQSYYYNDYENMNNFASSQDGVKMPRNSAKTEIVQHDDLTGKSSTVAVQKGNVLEIVPATNVTASTATSKEPQPIKKEIDTQTDQREDMKDELETRKDSATGISDDELARKIDEKEKRRERKKQRKQLKNHMRTTFQEEISRRLSVCTVNRINKEGDSLRSILANQTNSPIPPPKEKKKVLFADGIPPGHSSSASDDEMIQKRIIKKRLKKKRRKEEDKENTKHNMLGEDEIKIDPELEKLPPPPPPPGSPPSCLPQPVLKRPPSPEQLVYFHYDIVVDSMFISTNPIPIPPRLQNPNEDPQSQQGNSTSKQQNSSRSANMSHMSANTTINKVSYSNANKVASSSPNQTSKKKTTVEQKDCSPRPSQHPQPQPPPVHPSPSQSSTTSANSPSATSPIVRGNINPPTNVFSHPQSFRPQPTSVTPTQPSLPSTPTSQAVANPETSLRPSTTMRVATRPQVLPNVQNPSQSSPSGNNTPQRPSSLPSHGSPLVTNVPSPKPNAVSPIPGLGNTHAQSPCGFQQQPPLKNPSTQSLQSPGHGSTTGPPPNFIPPPMNTQNVNLLRPHCPPFSGNMSQMPPHMQPMRMPMMMHGPGPGHGQSPRGQGGPPSVPSPNQQMSMPPNMMFNRPRFPPRMMEPSGPRNPYPMQLPNPQMQMPNSQMPMQMPFNARFNDGQFPDQFSTPNYNPNIPPPYIKNRGPRQKFHSRGQSFNTEIRPQNYNPDMRQKNFRPQSFNTEIRPHTFPTDNRQQ